MKKSAPVPGLSNEAIEEANKLNKGLIGVGKDNRPLVDYLISNARAAGYSKLYLLIDEKGDEFKNFYDERIRNSRFEGMEFLFARQKIPSGRNKPLGTADAVLQTMDQFPQLRNKQFTVCNSDNLYSVKALLSLRKTQAPNALISYDRDGLNFPPEKIAGYAIVEVSGDNKLLNIVEKPRADHIDKFKDSEGKVRVSMNAFKLDGKMIYPYLQNCPLDKDRNEKELPKAVLRLSKEKPGSVLAIPRSEPVPDLTTKEDILAVNAYLKNFDGNEF